MPGLVRKPNRGSSCPIKFVGDPTIRRQSATGIFHTEIVEMKKSLLALAIAGLSMSQAFAFGNAESNASANAGAAAIAGAAAGAISGSVATGGNATGGSANSSLSSSIRNDVSSTNVNANSLRSDNINAQGQLQGQHQTAYSGGNKLTNEGNNSQQSTSVKVEGDVYEAPRIPVATAYAAPLTASNGTCMGSTSAGAQGVTIGLSVGITWTDSSCDARYDAQALAALGQPVAAIARLCQKAEIAAAMEKAGTACPGAAKKAAAPAAEAAASTEPTDPFIRSRLGLAPL